MKALLLIGVLAAAVPGDWARDALQATGTRLVPDCPEGSMALDCVVRRSERWRAAYSVCQRDLDLCQVDLQTATTALGLRDAGHYSEPPVVPAPAAAPVPSGWTLDPAVVLGGGAGALLLGLVLGLLAR